MSKLLFIAFVFFCGFGRPDHRHQVILGSSDDASSSGEVDPLAGPDAAASDGNEADDESSASLAYSHIKSLKTDAEFRDFVAPPRLTMVYFKPEAGKTTPDRVKVERTFLDAAKNTSEYLRWGFDVGLGKMNCEDVRDAELKRQMCEGGGNGETDNAHFYKKGGELIELEISTLFDEDSIIANILTILLINDIPIVETPDEIMKLQDEMAGKQNIVFSYYDKIGSATHRNVMEIAYTYKSSFQFVITSYNDSMAYLPLQNVDLANLPSVKILVLLCAEAEYSPCPLTSLPESREALPQYDFRTYLDNVLLNPIVEFPSASSSSETCSSDGEDCGVDAAAAITSTPTDAASFKSAFVDELIHEMTISFDSRSNRGEEARKYLRDSAKGMSLEYRGLVGFVLFDRAFQAVPPESPSPSVTIRFRPLTPDPTSSDPPPAVQTFDYADAFAFDGPALGALKSAVDKIISPPEKETAADQYHPTLADELLTIEDATVQKILNHFHKNKEHSWKNLVFDHVPQPKKNKNEFEQKLLVANGAKPKMVLFYLKTDGAGMSAALAFGAAAKRLNEKPETKDSLLRIQCMDWPDICESYGVFSYPIVKIFSRSAGDEGGEFVTRDWRGLVDADIIFAAASLLSREPVIGVGTPAEEAILSGEHFAKGQLMHLRARITGDKLREKYDTMAKEHQGEAVFLIEEGENNGVESVAAFCASASADAVIIFRPWDRLQPRVCVDLSTSVIPSAFALWSVISAAASRSPLPELTVKTFPAVIAERKPLLILFVDVPQESEPNALVGQEDRGKKIVAARLAKALLEGSDAGGDGSAAAATKGGEAAASAAIAGLTTEVAGVQVAWMNVAAHPLHQRIFNAYHPRGMSQDLPAVSYVDLKIGKVVNVPLQLALRGGGAWISGASAKALNYRTTSVAGVAPQDLRNMMVVQLEESNVGPQREHVDFKAKIAAEKEEKMNKTKTAEGAEVVDDEGLSRDKKSSSGEKPEICLFTR